ncbi:hypothetical protein H7H37_18840, partial [Mycolicibacterium insubricum]
SISRAGGLKQLVGGNLEGIDAREVNSIFLFDDAQGIPVYVRVAATARTWTGGCARTTRR